VDPARLHTVSGVAPAAVPLPVVEETSAGGLVIRSSPGGPHAAVIVRRNRGGRLEWCLPKGHLEGKETPEQAAVREIREETGIRGTVRTELGVIDYWFSGEDRRVHKVVHHFLLRADGGSISAAGDPDGEAEDALWVHVDDLPERLSYPNEQRLAQTAQQVLARDPGLVE
jgi:8-oxo-dGTP pyrophosphatase MutT (NUDIX family)